MTRKKTEEKTVVAEKVDRDAIMSRRRKLIASALAGFAVAAPIACGPCLDVEACLSMMEDADVSEDADGEDDATICLDIAEDADMSEES